MNEVTRRPNGPYLIEACLFLQRLVLLPVTVVCEAVAGYRDELHHMRDARPTWWG